MLTANEVITQVLWSLLTPRLPAMVGNDTLAIVVSSTCMKVASDRPIVHSAMYWVGGMGVLTEGIGLLRVMWRLRVITGWLRGCAFPHAGEAGRGLTELAAKSTPPRPSYKQGRELLICRQPCWRG